MRQKPLMKCIKEHFDQIADVLKNPGVQVVPEGNALRPKRKLASRRKKSLSGKFLQTGEVEDLGDEVVIVEPSKKIQKTENTTKGGRP